MSEPESIALPGLRVTLDKLVYHHDPVQLPDGRHHAFIYFLTVHNTSPHPVRLLGRKWVLQRADGLTEVVEGDRVVGKTPLLASGESFSYNSYHLTDVDCEASGSLHGVREDGGGRVHVALPSFTMSVPA